MNNNPPTIWGWVPLSGAPHPPRDESPSPLAALQVLSDTHCQRLFDQTATPAFAVTSLIELLEKTNSLCGTSPSTDVAQGQFQMDVCAIARLTLQGLVARIPRDRQTELPPDLYPALTRLSVVLEQSADLRLTTLPLCLSMMVHLDQLARGLPLPNEPLARPNSLRALLLDKTAVRQDPLAPLPFRRIKTLRVDDGNQCFTLALTNTLGSGTYGKFRLGLMRPGELLAIKEFRLPDDHAPRNQAKKTAPTHATNIAREVARLATLGSRIAPLQQIDYRGKRYLVMEAMTGCIFTASENILRLHPGDPGARHGLRRTLANSMLLQVAQALNVLHRAGYVHCDIKPHNILLARDGTIVLGDLGSAKARTSIALSGCTHQYMPFEDDGRTPLELRPAFDIFGLGMTWLGVLQPEQHRLSWQMDRLDGISMHHYARVIDPVVADYVFDQMLQPDPGARPSARDVIDFMEFVRGPDIRPAACEHIARTAMHHNLAQHETIRTRLEKSLQPDAQNTTEATRRSTQSEARRQPADRQTK